MSYKALITCNNPHSVDFSDVNSYRFYSIRCELYRNVILMFTKRYIFEVVCCTQWLRVLSSVVGCPFLSASPMAHQLVLLIKRNVQYRNKSYNTMSWYLTSPFKPPFHRRIPSYECVCRFYLRVVAPTVFGIISIEYQYSLVNVYCT